jgi:hypothetical protein
MKRLSMPGRNDHGRSYDSGRATSATETKCPAGPICTAQFLGRGPRWPDRCRTSRLLALCSSSGRDRSTVVAGDVNRREDHFVEDYGAAQYVPMPSSAVDRCLAPPA